MAIEIVDFPINSMVIFHSYVKLPEGRSIIYTHMPFSFIFQFFSWQTVSLLEGISSISIERSIQNGTFLQPNDGD